MNELALQAGRRRQSKTTGFVHIGDTIPIVENVCFALALMQSKTVENFLEGKELVERILHFQAESGNFPSCLHQYPKCDDYYLAADLLAPFHWMVELFPKIGPAYDKMVAHIRRQEVEPDPIRAVKIREVAGHCLHSPKLLGEFFVQQQMRGKALTPAPWHACSYAGPAFFERQEGFEPEVTLFDLYMGSWSGTFSKRALEDHPCHLFASLIRPIREPFIPLGGEVSLCLDPVPEHLKRWHAPYKRIWGTPERTHSLVVQGGEIRQEGERLIALCGEEERLFCLFLDRQPLEIFVEGCKANTFKIGEELRLETQEGTIAMKFEILEGEGDFQGHVMLGNRPSQISLNKFEAYDWQIFLRTIRRSPKCSISLSLRFS